MIAYGKPKELIKAVEEEKAKLSALKEREEGLNKFIDRKIKILDNCLNLIKKYSDDSIIQIIAISNCIILEL
nr:MAG: hypothetical protein TU35_05645 [Thermoproteus sp. AZ2]